jgi:predicted transcriptional regulator
MDFLEDEARVEGAIVTELRKQPLFALELATALHEGQRAVADAVVRLEAAGTVAVPSPGARFSLVRA